MLVIILLNNSSLVCYWCTSVVENSNNLNLIIKQGAALTEYTLRLIGSDIEHYIRKMLYDGEIKYNMNSRVLNFSMGKPRMKFNGNELPDVQ